MGDNVKWVYLSRTVGHHSSSFSCLLILLDLVVKDVNLRDNSLEALSTTPETRNISKKRSFMFFGRNSLDNSRFNVIQQLSMYSRLSSVQLGYICTQPHHGKKDY